MGVFDRPHRPLTPLQISIGADRPVMAQPAPIRRAVAPEEQQMALGPGALPQPPDLIGGARAAPSGPITRPEVPDGAVARYIAEAATAVGVDPRLLMGIATIESALNPNAQARTSSATGLFQFIESTWLNMVKQHGAKYGLEEYAEALNQGRVPNSLRQEILALRRDPWLASVMGAEYAAQSARDVRSTNPTDIYMAHFLGGGGARTFLGAMRRNPQQRADNVMPAAARANRSIFYTRTGRPRTLQEVYNLMGQKLTRAMR